MSRKVYSCREFDVVGVPVDELVVGGKTQVYSQASGRGFFDIDLRNGELVVTAKNFAGLIPLNDRIAIHVIPRFPIDNLFAIISRSDERAKFLRGFSRTYSLGPSSEPGVARLFGDEVVGMLGHVARNGLHRKYIPETVEHSVEGELLLSETVSRFRSAGIRYRHVRRRYVLSPSIVENRIIKAALARLVGFYGGSVGGDAKRLKNEAERLLIGFDQVTGRLSPVDLKGLSVPRLVASLPPMHQGYASVLWLSYLLESGHGVALEKIGSAVFDTFVVNLADVFESYVRNVIRGGIAKLGRDLTLRDGNKSPYPLFVGTERYEVRPDLYLLQGRAPVAVLDAKYKLDVKPADRYEVLAFCDALSVKLAILLAPHFPGSDDVQVLGVTPSGIRMVILRIDLSSADLEMQEELLLQRIEELIEPVLAP